MRGQEAGAADESPSRPHPWTWSEASIIQSFTSATGTDLNGDGVVDFTGRGGDIVVAVQHLNVLDGAAITSSTSSADDPGAAAGGTVTVQGLDGPGSKASSVLLSGQNTGIVSHLRLWRARQYHSQCRDADHHEWRRDLCRQCPITGRRGGDGHSRLRRDLC